ncbi:MAG: peptidylprolyl isomerase [Woeseiaceae bacterium]
MQSSFSSRFGIAIAIIILGALLPPISSATIVEVETNLGTFQVNLYDTDTPATVANFLAYVQDGNYSDSVIHRSVAGFIVQGGGLTTDGNATLSEITARAPVQNEPVFANVRGTIAMAKLASGPDTATSQWFFNLSDNTANLDNQNGGFTVFGQVIDDGMTVVDAIAAVPTFNNVFGLNDFPLQNYTPPNPLLNDNLVIITSITVVSTDADSAAGLNKPLTTRGDNNGGNNGGGTNLGGGGGGYFGLLSLISLLVLGRRRYRSFKTA